MRSLDEESYILQFSPSSGFSLPFTLAEVSKLQQLGVAVASLTSETRHNDKTKAGILFYYLTGV